MAALRAGQAIEMPVYHFTVHRRSEKTIAVRPMHKQFIEPTKRSAHVILPHGANGPAVDMITTKAVSFIRELQASPTL